MSMDEIEVARLRWEEKERFRLSNLPPWELPDAEEQDDEDEEEDSSQAPESEEEDDEDLAIYLGGDCV